METDVRRRGTKQKELKCIPHAPQSARQLVQFSVLLSQRPSPQTPVGGIRKKRETNVGEEGEKRKGRGRGEEGR